MIKPADFSAMLFMNCFIIFARILNMEPTQCKNCLRVIIETTESFQYCSLECGRNYQYLLEIE